MSSLSNRVIDDNERNTATVHYLPSSSTEGQPRVNSQKTIRSYSYISMSPIDSGSNTVYDGDKEYRGGDGMDGNYVTKSEFEMQSQLFDNKLERIGDKIQNLDDKLTLKLDMHNQVMANKFEHLEDKVSSEFKHLEDNVSSKLGMQNQIIMNKLDNITSDIENSIKLALYEKEERDREREEKELKERRDTRRYIVGTMIIGGTGVIVGIASLLFSIFSK